MAKIALLIGVNEYGNGLSSLPAAAKDVEGMREVLENSEIGGFDQVTPLINPERQAMEEAIYTLFANRKKDDLLLLFFSGHGVKDDSGNLYLAAHNTRKQEETLVQPTAVAASYIQNIMSNSRSKRQVVILDCCFSGAFAEGMKAKDDGCVPVKQQLGGEGRAVLTSSTSTQYSFEHPGFELSVYTHFLVEGLKTGIADRDKDGRVSIDELHEYACEKVQETAPEKMKPKIYVVEEGFKILLAKVRIDDPKLKYRQEIERRIKDRKIPFVARNLLDFKRDNLGLLAQEAAAIEAEVLKPYQEYEAKLQQYEQLLSQVILNENPLTEYTANILKDYQEFWGLRGEDIEIVKNRIIPSQKVQQTINSTQILDSNLTKLNTQIKSSIEGQRHFEAAMPQKSKVGRRTEIRAMVALPDSLGLRAHLPSFTDSGDVITKNDVVGNDTPLEFPVNQVTGEPLPINLFLGVTAPDFEIEQVTKNIFISPKLDSGIITLFLIPRIRQRHGRVILELFKDEQRTILLSSLTLITEVRGRHDDLVDVVWHLATITLSSKLAKQTSIGNVETSIVNEVIPLANSPHQQQSPVAPDKILYQPRPASNQGGQQVPPDKTLYQPRPAFPQSRPPVQPDVTLYQPRPAFPQSRPPVQPDKTLYQPRPASNQGRPQVPTYDTIYQPRLNQKQRPVNRSGYWQKAITIISFLAFVIILSWLIRNNFLNHVKIELPTNTSEPVTTKEPTAK
ncbi:caspase, EACC1-associated type [Nostoc sp.]|uniref:caspase, EACC1-associated type n=1 Tax=Nostoc sp. TaxID=1180 RepID=UPI002FF46A14